MVKKRLKVFFAVLCCLVIIITFLSGCTYNLTYRGKYPDLYTVAINSILWNAGYSQGHHAGYQPEIEMLEKDDYGRTLYTYYELARAEYNLVISQYSEEDYVYYYEDFNFLTKEITNPRAEFSKEETDYLKSLNDWGKEIDLGKCVKKQIIREKQSIPCDEKIIEEKIARKFNEKEERFDIYIDYLTNDNLGNFLVYGYIWLKNENRTHIYFVILIDVNCEEFNFFVPTELYSYQEEFKTFKAENGWVSK